MKTYKVDLEAKVVFNTFIEAENSQSALEQARTNLDLDLPEEVEGFSVSVLNISDTFVNEVED